MKKILLVLFFPFFVFSQSSWNMNLLGTYDYPTTQGNDIWGWVDANWNEFALVGLRSGVSCVDVTNPTNPVEMFFIADLNSTWRDIKTWGNYAYVTTEANAGLLIIDLNDMTGNTYWHRTNFTNPTTGTSLSFTSAHNIYIDENGIAYIFGAGGAGPQSNGAIFLDVATNPINPVYLGEWSEQYIHDAMVRGDTMWAGCINSGKLYAVDVSNKSNPLTLGSATTPNAFTHNAWVSDDGNYVFTTDEQSGAYLTAYDVSDVNNIQEVDRIRSNSGSGTIPHNVHVDGNFLITSYYRDGTTVHDITHPNYMIKVAHYDSYAGSGNGFDGCWGTYPFLPSGNIISSDINSGVGGKGKLLIYGRNFQQACYLQGEITDCISGLPISNVNVEIINTTVNESTNLLGKYQTAIVDSGSYQVVYSAVGYENDTVLINLDNGIMITQDVVMCPPCSTFNIVSNNNAQICSGMSYVIGNSSYNTTGIYADTLVNYFGCDSIVHTNLTVLNAFSFSNPQYICQGEYYQIGSNVYSSPGNYTDTFVAVTGCDSTVNTNLIVYPIYNTSQYIDICNGDVYVIGQHVYNVSGTYYDTLSSSTMCDSIVITQLNVSNLVGILSATPPFLNMAVNGGGTPYSYLWNTSETTPQITPTTNGWYWCIVTDVNGCIGDTAFYEVTGILTGVLDYSISDIKIYPNPSKDVFNISFTSEAVQNLKVRVINLVVEEIVLEDLEQFIGEYTKQINLKDNTKGIYFLEIETDAGIINKKLIFQ